MRKLVIPSLVLLLGFWVVGGSKFLPATSKALDKAAYQKLSDTSHRQVFSDVKVRFRGQEADLTGVVASEEDKQLAAKIIANEIRLPDERGAHLNPVIAVHNQIVVDPSTSKLPAQWIITSFWPGQSRVDGVLKDPTDRQALLEKIKANTAIDQINSQATISEFSRKATDWPETLQQTPAFKDLIQGKPEKQQGIIAVTACDGKWTTFPPTATDEQISEQLKGTKVTSAEIAHTLKSIRAWHISPDSKALAAAAAEKARLEAEARAAQAERERAAAAEKAAQEAAAKTPPTPAYAGLHAASGKLSLFGKVPAEEQKSLAITTAEKIYTGYEIDASNLTVDASRAVPSSPSIVFPPVTATQKDFVALATFDGNNKLYTSDVFDSEITKDFRGVKFSDGELAGYLSDFRTSLANAGALAKDDPYLAIVSDGKTLLVSGEVAEAATKTTIIEKVTTANPGLTLSDKLSVSMLVNATPALAPTLESIPSFTASQSGVAIARPGQKWRSAVVHSIYFKTGSDRSKDQERAIYQMRRIRELLPTATFEIVGHTDNVGKVATNNQLSLKRANSFVTYARDAGFDPGILSSRGAGPSEPIAPNDSPASQALNRRVDVMLK